MAVKVCPMCGKESDEELFDYTSNGEGPMCPDCADFVEAELEAEEAKKLCKE